MNDLEKKLDFLNPVLVDELLQIGTISEIPAKTEIFRAEQYIKVLPIVLSGLVKVFLKFEEKELLLYYIQPSQSCVMSFAACLHHKPSKIYAITDEDSEVLLIPSEKLPDLLERYQSFNRLVHDQYDLRYVELLDTIQHVFVDRMDKRLHDYLVQRAKITKNETLKISHQQIAKEMGTAREVISRIMKKLEIEGKLVQSSIGIKLLP